MTTPTLGDSVMPIQRRHHEPAQTTLSTLHSQVGGLQGASLPGNQTPHSGVAGPEDKTLNRGSG